MSWKEVTDADGRKLELREISLTDMFDIIESAGEVAGNQVWLKLAMLVCSVSAIDGVPVMLPRDKKAIRVLAGKLATGGLAAVQSVLMPPAPVGDEDTDKVVIDPAGPVATAKN